MTESHKRGVEHMPLQLENSMREENERKREWIHIAKERFVCCQMSGLRKVLMKREESEMKNLEESGERCRFI